MERVIDLNVFQVIAAYLFVLLLLFIVRIKGIRREREILISSVRMTLQLILTGYMLMYIFESSSPLYTIAVLSVMQIFAVRSVISKFKSDLTPELKKSIVISLFSGTMICLIYFITVVMRVSPWYEARNIIPVAGMIIGNSMTAVSLGLNNLITGMRTEKSTVEGALMLGASPKSASKHIIDRAFDSAILPTVNSMIGMGIVFLPGMMTGQILSGTSPVTAIEYQIAIMLAILGSVSLSVTLLLELGFKSFFNEEKQLI